MADKVVPMEPTPELTFARFREANVRRCLKWHPAGIESWSPSDWLTAVTGELGELASLLKMRNRERDGLPGNKFSPSDKQVADEIADVLTYLDLLAAALGVNLGHAAAAKFNEVSARVGFPDRIDAAPAAVAPEAARCEHEWHFFCGPDDDAGVMRCAKCGEWHNYSPAKAQTAAPAEAARDWERINSVCDTGQLGDAAPAEAPQGDDLVARLRGKAKGQNVGITTHLFDAAAARIESDDQIITSLRVEVARLRGRNATQSKCCTCSISGLEPADDCPLHGHPWPPRCAECGKFLPWRSTPDSAEQGEAK